jgi:hypothetical protein
MTVALVGTPIQPNREAPQLDLPSSNTATRPDQYEDDSEDEEFFIPPYFYHDNASVTPTEDPWSELDEEVDLHRPIWGKAIDEGHNWKRYCYTHNLLELEPLDHELDRCRFKLTDSSVIYVYHDLDHYIAVHHRLCENSRFPRQAPWKITKYDTRYDCASNEYDHRHLRPPRFRQFNNLFDKRSPKYEHRSFGYIVDEVDDPAIILFKRDDLTVRFFDGITWSEVAPIGIINRKRKDRYLDL